MNEVQHALQILITGKNLAGPAIKEAGNLLSMLGRGWGLLSKAFAPILTAGKTALQTGLQIPATAASLALKGLGAGLGLVTSAIGTVVTGAAALTAGIVALGTAIASATPAATKYAAELETMYRAMWGVAGEATPALIEALEEASAFMVSEKGILRSWNMAYMLVGDTLTERLPEAFEYLSKVALATGDDVEFLMERLTRSIGRLSTRWMAYIGTVVDTEEATEHAKVMFGKTADELSREELQAAMLDRVLEKLAARTSAMPEIVGTANQMFRQLRTIMRDIWGDWGKHFIPVAQSVLRVLINMANAIKTMINEGGALYGPIRKIAATLSVLFDIVGEIIEKFIGVISPASSQLETFFDKIISAAWNAIKWGASIMTNLATGIIQGASQALTAAMNFVAGILESWLAPHSPPRIVADIIDWGAAAFTEFLRGFSMADFDVLESVQAPLKRALSILAGLGEITEVQSFEMFIGISEQMAEAIAEFGRTGAVSGDLLAELSAITGGYGSELVKLFSAQLDVATATQRAADAEERLKRAQEAQEGLTKKLSRQAREYNKMVRDGADPAILKQKLAQVEASHKALVAAREETEQAEKSKEEADAILKQKQEEARLQERLLNQLLQMGQALLDLKKAQEKEAEYELPPIEWPEFHPPPIDTAFEELKESIRTKFEELWASLVKQWEESGVKQAIDDVALAWDRLKTSLDPLWARMEAIWTATKGWVTDEAWPWITDKWQAWRDWWETNGPEISRRIGKIGDVVSAWMADEAWPWVIKQWQKWQSWWEINGPGIEKRVGTVAHEVKIWATEDLWAFVTKEWDKWKVWWEAEGPTLFSLISEFFTQVGNLFLLFDTWTPTWDSDWSTIASIVGLWWNAIKLEIAIAFETIRGSLSFWAHWFLGEWALAWGHAVTTFWNIFGLVDDYLGGALTNLVAAFLTWLDSPITSPLLWGILIGQRIREGIQQNWYTVTTELSGLLGTLALILDWYWEDFKAIGTGIVDAIRDAIIEAPDKIKNALQGIIDAAIEAIRSALGLYSPSKLFFGFGQNLMSGFVLGIESMANKPAASLRRITSMAEVAGGTLSGPAVAGQLNQLVTGGQPQLVIHNHFGRDSVRDERDVYLIAEQIERSLSLRGARGTVG